MSSCGLRHTVRTVFWQMAVPRETDVSLRSVGDHRSYSHVKYIGRSARMSKRRWLHSVHLCSLMTTNATRAQCQEMPEILCSRTASTTTCFAAWQACSGSNPAVFVKRSIVGAVSSGELVVGSARWTRYRVKSIQVSPEDVATTSWPNKQSAAETPTDDG